MASQTFKNYSIFTIMFITTVASLVGIVLLHLYAPHSSIVPIGPPVEIVETVILNATIWLGPGEYAQAMAIKDGKIFAVGDSANISRYAGEKTYVRDAGQGFIVPGFIESHAHTITSGFALSQVQLRDANTTELFIARIAKFAASSNSGQWITGGNWNHQLWGGELPTRDWIDNVTRNNPVFINRLDGHMGLANSLALQRAEINASTADPPGGEIVRVDGIPTGILKDNAMDIVFAAIPKPSPEAEDKALNDAMLYFAQNGITSVHHMGTLNDRDIFKRNKNKLRVRFNAAVPLSEWKQLATIVETEGKGDDWLKWGSLKGFVDGSLGSETAKMFDPYLDNPNNTGLYVTPLDNIYAWTLQADKADLQVCIHAIGDKANYDLLNIYKNITETSPRKDRRFRIEHAQHVRFEDIPLFTENSIIASVQPYHIIDDGDWAETLIGPVRANYTYPLKSFLDRKVRLAFGSDWDVAPANPLQALYGALTRRTLNGKNPNGWIPAQKIDIEGALLAYTSDAAYAQFAEDRKGKLAVGYLADLVILDKNIFEIPPEDLWNVEVKLTLVNGTVSFDRKITMPTKSRL